MRMLPSTESLNYTAGVGRQNYMKTKAGVWVIHSNITLQMEFLGLDKGI